jgi:hypothetical protein
MTAPAFVIVPFERTQLLHETGELSRCAIVRRPTRSEVRQFYELGVAGDRDGILAHSYALAGLAPSSVALMPEADLQRLDAAIIDAFNAAAAVHFGDD